EPPLSPHARHAVCVPCIRPPEPRMTLRLIALMSVTLFCCLAAFGLLLSRSEDAIMEEVERTVSEAGKQTVAAFAKREVRFVAGGDGAIDLALAFTGRGAPAAAGGVAHRLFGPRSPLDECDCPIHRAMGRPTEFVMVTVEGNVESAPPPGIREWMERAGE